MSMFLSDDDCQLDQDATPPLITSGARLIARYRLHGPAAVAEACARAICLEQTVEFPDDLLRNAAIRAQIVGQVTAFGPIGDDDGFVAEIAYPVEAAGRELTQLLNLLFGNISLLPGIQLLDIALPERLLAHYRGPRFGRDGLRALLDVRQRPLLCTALKPMGLSARELAALAYRLALGGIDLIKDDHGLSDQPFCPFAERVPRCAEAIARANRETGGHCRYVPHVTAPAPEIARRAHAAKAAGAGGLLFCPGLAGWDAMRALADDATLALPILAHPAFLGGWCLNSDSGLSPRVLFGQFARLAGADASIFPSFGGRFAFSPAQCRELVAGATEPFGSLRPILPVPAGGIRIERITELRAFYGADCILLIGGELHRGEDLIANCRRLVATVSVTEPLASA